MFYIIIKHESISQGAYSVRNPDIGYCQSMNFVVGILLLYMEEEDAFWSFTGIIEDILPEHYYSDKLLGCRVDQQVFSSCIAWKLPEVAKLLERTETILEPVTCSWFMSCFANILPHRVVFRLWDCLLWEGNVALMRAGISLIRAKSQLLMGCDDSMGIYMELRDISPHIEVIMGGLSRSLSSSLHVSEHCINSEEASTQPATGGGSAPPSPTKSNSLFDVVMGSSRYLPPMTMNLLLSSFLYYLLPFNLIESNLI